MAVLHVVAGPVTVSFNSAELGFTRDGVEILYDPRFGDIFSDDFGGAGGAPADTQILGLIGSVTCELTKYDTGNVEALTSFVAGGTTGVLPPLGTLIRQEEKFGSLSLAGTIKTYTYDISFPRAPQSVNAGTRFSTYTVGFEFWINNPTNRQFATIT